MDTQSVVASRRLGASGNTMSLWYGFSSSSAWITLTIALGKWLADRSHGADLSETCVMDYSWAEPYLNYSVVYEENVVKLAPGV